MAFLTTIIASSIVLLPPVEAHTPPWRINSYAYLFAAPDPVGVNQNVYISMWIDVSLPGSMVTNNIRRENYTLTITAPDGTVETMHWDVVDDTTNVQSISYVPDQVGNYTITFTYGGQVYRWNDKPTSPYYVSGLGTNAIYENDTYGPASKTITLTVQEEPIQPITVYPLPTEYWSRPIEGQNLNWATIASQWLRGNYFGTFQMSINYNLWQRDGAAPNSAHVLWTKPLEYGGVVGGTSAIPDVTEYSGGSYEGRFQNTIIMNGMIFVQLPLGHSGNGGGYACYNLLTGEQIWYRSDLNAYVNNSATTSTLIAAPSFAQLLDFESPNQHGVVGGVLWQSSTVGTGAAAYTVWQAIDGFTGKWMYNLTNIPTGTDVYTTQGELVRYVLGYNTTSKVGWLALWNSTQALLAIGTGYNINSWRPVGNVINGSTAYSWNYTFTGDITGSTAPAIFSVLPGDILLGRSSNLAPGVGARFTDNPFTMWALNLNSSNGAVAALKWVKSYAAPEGGNLTLRLGPTDPVNRVWTMNDVEYMQWRGFNLDTGAEAWGPTDTNFRSLQFFGSGEGGGPRGVTAYGNIYVQGFGGELFCYSTADGSLLWRYNNTNSGLETAWGLRPIFISAIAEGKVYAFNNEHSPNAPLYRGNKVYCLNATTGAEIWTLMGWSGQTGGQGGSTAVLADGYLSYYNYYDNNMYVVGKGSSATTISAGPKSSAMGNAVLLEGKVIDTSPGTRENEVATRFPEGVAAVNDISQNIWMEYIYMQKPRPTNATGVPVVLSVVDANGNYREIGNVTTDLDGFYSYVWTPDIEGAYTAYASFAGSDSYWPSHAVTAFNIASPSTTASPTAPPQEGIADTYFLAAVIGIIAAIVIVGVILAVLVSRRH
ncbi:MAG: PQQ-binding-like beta-propeller repeat protein [Candidatus Bathyarchaeota archaeon]|nr:PQQ-binding-like beta-propeller repeat protein [Candidatus Bathyarchaeota archaeon]